MELRSYETVFIMTPVLSEEQIKQTIGKYVSFLEQAGSEIVYQYKYKLQKLAYPIQKKKTGIYQILEFKAKPNIIVNLEREFILDDNIIRFLTVCLDKHGVEYNKKKREKVSSEKDVKEINTEQKEDSTNKTDDSKGVDKNTELVIPKEEQTNDSKKTDQEKENKNSTTKTTKEKSSV